MQIYNIIGLIAYPLTFSALIALIFVFSDSLLFQIRNKFISLAFIFYGVLLGWYFSQMITGIMSRLKNLSEGEITFVGAVWAVEQMGIALTLWAIVIMFLKNADRKGFELPARNKKGE
jgi:hypothetical protein